MIETRKLKLGLITPDIKDFSAQRQALIEGLTVRDAAARCGVAKTTSFRWRNRFLTDIAELKVTSLTGIVEADETYFPLSFKGSRQLPRPPHRRGHAIHQRGTGKCRCWYCVIVMTLSCQ